MKRTFLVCVCSFLMIEASAQNDSIVDPFQVKGLNISLLTGYQTFQDTRYSHLIYDGLLYGINIRYYNQKERRIWEVGGRFLAGGKSTTVGKPYGSVLVCLYGSYLRNILHRGKHHCYLGVQFDLLDMYMRYLEEDGEELQLTNNPVSTISGTQFSLKGMYMYDLSPRWQFQSLLKFQLFGFMKQSPSFATSTSQHSLESDQTYSYDKNVFSDDESPLAIFKTSFQPFYKYFNVVVEQRVVYKQQWSLSYRWVFRHSREVVGYPLTQGFHFVGLGYQF